MLKANNIGLKLGQRSILKGINFQLTPGEVKVVLGPNGAGKTSLMKVLSGEWKSDSGNVVLNGDPLEKIPVRRLGQLRAYLHQESSLDFSFTVLEVVLLGRCPHMQGSERPEDYDAARRALREVDLVAREHDFYTALSGGEKQRVHLARVLCQIEEESITDPRYLFLDEPTNNLDLSHQQTIYRITRRLAVAGTAVCMVMHDLNHAFQIADTVTLLDQGNIVIEGNPAELATSDEWDRVFEVRLKRIQIEGSPCPHLLFDPEE